MAGGEDHRCGDRDGDRLAVRSGLMCSTLRKGWKWPGDTKTWQERTSCMVAAKSTSKASATCLQAECLAWTWGFVPPRKTGEGCACWVLLRTCIFSWHFSPVSYQISVLEDAKLTQITSVCVLLKYSTLSRTR